MESLKPCPSGHEDNCKIELWGDWFVAACQEPGCGWQTGFHATEEDARRAWNALHPDPVKAELVEALSVIVADARSYEKRHDKKISWLEQAESALKKAGVQD